MAKIKTLYVANHSHTDIGFTDYQDLCFRQHAEFIDQALDLIEATAGLPGGGALPLDLRGHRADREVASRRPRPAQIERFKHWHERGPIDVAGMQYNHTPLQNVEQMIRSLYPVRAPARRLRPHDLDARCSATSTASAGSTPTSCPQIGIELLTMAVNPLRGYAPKPFPGAFWWEGPAGNKVLAWNGFHYLWGRSIAKLGDWRFVDQSLPPIVAKLEADPTTTRSTSSTRSRPIRSASTTARPTRGCPTSSRDWNAQGRTPRIVFTTPAEFNRMLRERYGDDLATRRGDWPDWWTDGVASSAYETGRQPRHARAPARWPRRSSLAHERGHDGSGAPSAPPTPTSRRRSTTSTPGARSPASPPRTRSGPGRSGTASPTTSTPPRPKRYDLLARAARALAETVAEPGIEGMFNLGDLDPRGAYPETGADVGAGDQHAAVGPRTVVVEEPEQRGWAAPAGVLGIASSRATCRGAAAARRRRSRRVAGEVPASATRSCRSTSQPSRGRSRGRPEHDRERALPGRGSTRRPGRSPSGSTRSSGHDFAGEYQGWGIGQYVYERVDSPEGRQALFWGDFSTEDFGYGRTDTPWQRSTVAVGRRSASRAIAHGRASIAVDVDGAGHPPARAAPTRSRAGTKSLAIDWMLDKEHQTGIEAVFVAFPFNLGAPQFRADVNGVPFTPKEDQLDGTVRDWYPIGRWVDVSDGERGVTVTPLDAPLVHLGGITTGKWARTLEPEGPTLDVLGAEQPLDGQLQGQPGGRDPAALPPDDPRRPLRRRRRRPLRRRERDAADRAARLPAHRPGDRPLPRRASGRAGAGHRQAGRRWQRRDRAGPEPDDGVRARPAALPGGDAGLRGPDLAGRGRWGGAGGWTGR